MTENTTTFKESYAILKKVAETLRTQQEPDIDALVPMVDSAMAAYSICKQRIEAAKQAFSQKVQESQ